MDMPVAAEMEALDRKKAGLAVMQDVTMQLGQLSLEIQRACKNLARKLVRRADTLSKKADRALAAVQMATA